MHFVDQVDLIASTCRHVLGVFKQISGVIDTSAGRSVYLDQIDEAIFFHLEADRAFAARRRANTTLAVKTLSQNACNGSLAHAPCAGKQIGVVQAVVVEGVSQSTHHMILTHQGRKAAGPKFSC